MAMIAKKQAAMPLGPQTGVIVGARETERDFGSGPEATFEITIRPDYVAAPGVETLPTTVNFTPSLNGLSGLSKLLQRLGVHPAEGREFDASTLNGVAVSFTAEAQRNGFARVNKESLTLAPKRQK